MKGTWKKSGKASLSLLLAVLLLAGIGASASAADTGAGENKKVNTQTIPVQGTYETAAASETIFVDISWKGMSFTYTPAHKGEWNPDSHTYGKDVQASWKSSDSENGYGTITVKNQSATEVTNSIIVTFNFVPDGSFAHGQMSMKFADNPGVFADGVTATEGFSTNTKIIYLGPTNSNEFEEKSVYIVPSARPDVTSFPSSGLGKITMTIEISAYDPGLPGPSIESVQPAPEAGEIAANG